MIVDKYTKLLIHFEDASFKDVMGNPIIASGVILDPSLKKFGASSGYFNGNGYISLPITSDFTFGTKDFTIDWWEYRTAVQAVGDGIFHAGISSNYGFLLGHQGKYIYISSGTTWDIAGGYTYGEPVLNSWQHIAVVRSGNNFYAFRNGVLQSTWSSSASIVAPTSIFIGKYTVGVSTCNIDEFRISNVARWTANFTVPTSPYNKLLYPQDPQILTFPNVDTTSKSGIALISPTDIVTTDLLAVKENASLLKRLDSSKAIFALPFSRRWTKLLGGNGTIPLINFGTYYAWADGTYAKSATEYKNPTLPYTNNGSAPDGVYRIQPPNTNYTVDLYCDMTRYDGGWMLVMNTGPKTTLTTMNTQVGTLPITPTQSAMAKVSDSVLNALRGSYGKSLIFVDRPNNPTLKIYPMFFRENKAWVSDAPRYGTTQDATLTLYTFYLNYTDALNQLNAYGGNSGRYGSAISTWESPSITPTGYHHIIMNFSSEGFISYDSFAYEGSRSERCALIWVKNLG